MSDDWSDDTIAAVACAIELAVARMGKSLHALLIPASTIVDYYPIAKAAIAAMPKRESSKEDSITTGLSKDSRTTEPESTGEAYGRISLGSPDCKKCNGYGYTTEGIPNMYERGSRRTASLCSCAIERMPRI